MLEMSASSANASMQTLVPLTSSTFNNSVIQICPLVLDASFQFIDIRDLGTIYSLLKHTPHPIVDRVEVGRVRQPQRGWDKICTIYV